MIGFYNQLNFIELFELKNHVPARLTIKCHPMNKDDNSSTD